jgi:hypothetical protein
MHAAVYRDRVLQSSLLKLLISILQDTLFDLFLHNDLQMFTYDVMLTRCPVSM